MRWPSSAPIWAATSASISSATIQATLWRSTSACSLASSLSATWAAVILGPSAIVVLPSSISWNRPTILRRRGGRTHIRPRRPPTPHSATRPAGDRLEVATGAGRVPLRVVWSRPLPSPPSSVTVCRDHAARWWASFVVRIEAPAQPLALTGRATGLDLGLGTFATTCDAESDFPNPRLGRGTAKALVASQRKLARRRKGSANRAKARRRRARIEAKIAARRADFHHKAARSLVGAYDRIGVEKLAVKRLSRRGRGRRKTGLNRSIIDAGWGRFLRVLTWQATKAGKQVVVLPAGG